MRFRPQSELQNFSGCIVAGFGLAFVLGGMLISGPETTFLLLGRILVSGFGLVVLVASLYSYRYYWITDELITTPDHLVVWSKKQQTRLGWDEIERLTEDAGGENTYYIVKLRGRPTILLGEGEEARWFLYECARLSGVRVTKKGTQHE